MQNIAHLKTKHPDLKFQKNFDEGCFFIRKTFILRHFLEFWAVLTFRPDYAKITRENENIPVLMLSREIAIKYYFDN